MNNNKRRINMKNNIKFSFCFLLILILSQINTAQTIGKIFSKEEADKNFGPVLSSVSIASSELKTLISQSDKYIMFSVKDGKLSILRDDRILLYPEGFKVNADEKYAVYSKSKVEELLNSGKADTTIIEQRKDVISITNGQHTLEMASWCPPFC
jgi:hypothetical protein